MKTTRIQTEDGQLFKVERGELLDKADVERLIREKYPQTLATNDSLEVRLIENQNESRLFQVSGGLGGKGQRQVQPMATNEQPLDMPSMTFEGQQQQRTTQEQQPVGNQHDGEEPLPLPSLAF